MSTLNIPLLSRRSKKIPEFIAINVLTWRPDQASVARTIHISYKFLWPQRCSSHWSATVYVYVPCSAQGPLWPMFRNNLSIINNEIVCAFDMFTDVKTASHNQVCRVCRYMHTVDNIHIIRNILMSPASERKSDKILHVLVIHQFPYLNNFRISALSL